jgi:hypothetical protein
MTQLQLVEEGPSLRTHARRIKQLRTTCTMQVITRCRCAYFGAVPGVAPEVTRASCNLIRACLRNYAPLPLSLQRHALHAKCSRFQSGMSTSPGAAATAPPPRGAHPQPSALAGDRGWPWPRVRSRATAGSIKHGMCTCCMQLRWFQAAFIHCIGLGVASATKALSQLRWHLAPLSASPSR